jgi:arylsulfatase
MVKNPPLASDVWELYNVDEDFSEANDLADKNPQKLKELQDIFTKEAIKNHVFPIDDRRSERFDAAQAGRPDLMGPRTSLTVYEGMVGISENTFINIKTRNYTITSEVELRDGNTNGVILAQAGRFGGWVLYMKGGKVHHEYNFFGLQRTNITSSQPVGAGKHTIKYEFTIAERKPGSGGKCTLYVDNQKVAEGQIPKTVPFAFSADEGADVGTDNETAVSNDYKMGDNKFTGKIIKITVDTNQN